MDQKNIDRLFRENLDDFEITPSPKAWSEVEKHIGRKNNTAVYWIAASISLFIISWVVWPEQKAETFGIASQEIDHPSFVQSSQPDIPIAVELIEKVETKVPVKKSIIAPKVQMVAAETVEKIEEVKTDKITIPEIEKKTAVALEEIEELPIDALEEVSEATDIVEPEISTVKITYIASNNAGAGSKELKSDSTGVLKKFIAFTEKLDPGEMLADIKTAKDNLLSGGFKNKKDRSVMTP